ncbi:MAG TPA: phenylalanine--tRNA ligase subunit alpha [Actinomycetota bacterium]|nr:phenylalanine--tRNA ligase subunit alpha [Actinomycetota bacterium]
MSPVDELELIEKEALEALGAADSSDRVQELQIVYLGRKGPLARVGKTLGTLPVEERKLVGQAANRVRGLIESAIAGKLADLDNSERAGRLEAERLDITLPGRKPPTGKLHPLTVVLEEIVDIFVGLGFQVAEGPLVETDYYSFQALNIPQDHAARSMQDTFYVDTGAPEPYVLRPHTSPMQARVMESGPPPHYMVVPGVVARRDEIDANHLAQFMQIEGFAVDEGISFSDLKGVLQAFARQMFGDNLTVRMHPSYFPFTEPSAEVYVSCFACDGSGCPTCRGEGWIEILGAGMIHPNVFRSVGYPPSTTGFAFGMGVERIAKLKYSVNDLRTFYENDLRFLDAR